MDPKITTGAVSPMRTRRGPLSIASMFVRQVLTEFRLRARRLSFRTRDQAQLERSYGAMTPQEFEEVNAPQGLMNEFAIPRALAKYPHDRPWRLVDLGCGSGGSSAILARQAPPGSSLIGYDLSASLLDTARRRDLRDCEGRPLPAEFVCQSITEPLRTPGGELLPAGSVDVSHAAGIVGHHLRPADLEMLARELRRVLAPQGLAILDSGPKLGPRTLAQTMHAAGFELVARHRLLPFARRTASVFRLRAAKGSDGADGASAARAAASRPG